MPEKKHAFEALAAQVERIVKPAGRQCDGRSVSGGQKEFPRSGMTRSGRTEGLNHPRRGLATKPKQEGFNGYPRQYHTSPAPQMGPDEMRGSRRDCGARRPERLLRHQPEQHRDL